MTSEQENKKIELTVDESLHEPFQEEEGRTRIEVDQELIQTYLPDHVLQSMASGRDVQSERKIVTVVFADISGFTSMSEAMDPEEVTRIMNGCFKVLTEEIYRHKGTVDKFIGDCVMALWGVPTSRENDAELAVRSCIAMLDGLEKYNKTLEVPLGLSLGINTGVCVAATVGGERFRQYTVMGDTVNLAQRLESAAERGQILVSRSVAKACQGTVDFLEHEPIMVKGKEKPVDIFSPVRAKAVVSDKIEAARKEVRLCGRDEQIKLLENSISKLQQGSGGAVSIFEDPGMGKSRMLRELQRMAQAAGVRSFAARGHEMTQNMDLALFAAIIRNVAGVNTDDNLNAARIKIANAASGIEPIQESALARLTIQKSFIPEENDEELDPKAQQEKLIEAAKDFCLKATTENPLLLMFDDIHHADWTSVRALARAAQGAIGHKLLVAFAGRQQKRLSIVEHYGRIKLAALQESQISELASVSLEREEIPENLAEFLTNRTGGNPLYILQVIDSLKHAGVIYLRGQQWRVDRNIDASSLPDTLAALMATRVDNLPPDERDVLSRAATIGQVVSAELLRRFADYEATQRLVDKLIRSNLMEIADDEVEVFYVFTHPMFHETTYGRVLNETRRQWHGEIAALMELENLTDTNSILQITDHYRRSNEIGKADSYLVRAIQLLDGQAAYAGALKYATYRVELLNTTQGETAFVEEDHERRLAEASLQLGRLERITGESDRAESALKRAVQYASNGNHNELHAQALLELGAFLKSTGDYAEAEMHLKQADQLFSDLEIDPVQQLQLQLELADIAEAKGQNDDAYMLLRAAMEHIKGSDDLRFIAKRIRAVNRMGVTALKCGRTEEAIDRLNQALKVAKKRELPVEEAYVYANLAAYHASQGDLTKGINLAGKALRMGQDVGDYFLIAKQHHNLANFYLNAGDRDDALASLAKCELLAERIGWKEGIAMNALLADKIG